MSKKNNLESELLQLLAQSNEVLAEKYGSAEPLGGFSDVLKIGPHSVLMVQDQSLHLINPGNSGIAALAKVIQEVRRRDLPLTTLFLTTSHPFYSTELHLYQGLSSIDSKKFGFKVFTHQKNASYAEGASVVTFSSAEEFLKIGGRRYFVVQTPGNRPECDQVSLFDLKNRILFLGELLQPQGESYEFCTFVTPVPDHADPDAVVGSIQNLKSLAFEYSYCVNGQFLDRSRTYVWMEVTQKVLERIAYYARKVVWEEDSGDLLENAKKVMFKVAMERNMSLDLIYARMDSPIGEASDFEKYDLPPISFYLRRFGMQGV